MTATHVQRNYKDTMFRILFKEKEQLLSLYNAVNRTSYTDVENLEITTLENAVYMNYKNDISFVFDFELMLYEHQSTVNPNMPLRDLIYVTKVLQNIIKNEDIYHSVLIKLPTPRFVVFYNGTDFQPSEQILKLSDAFERKMAQPELELIVTVYNINWGCNSELMETCWLLRQYAQYVEQVRVFAKSLPFSEAVEQAVDFCIRNDILADFLSKNRAEAIEMSIFEYNEEQHLKCEREWAYKNGQNAGIEQGRAEGISLGREEGISLGREEGEQRLARLLQILMDTGRDADLSRAICDPAYRETLYLENNL